MSGSTHFQLGEGWGSYRQGELWKGLEGPDPHAFEGGKVSAWRGKNGSQLNDAETGGTPAVPRARSAKACGTQRPRGVMAVWEL
jgi:hypothetical protein